MKQVYPVLICKEGKDHLVYVPDLDLYTEGKTFADAIMMARDAIGLKGIDLEDDGVALPVPSDANAAINKAKADTDIYDYSKGIVTYVDVDFFEYRRKMDMKTVRRNVALPSWLNYEAEKAGINVSRVLQDALMSVLNVSRK